MSACASSKPTTALLKSDHYWCGVDGENAYTVILTKGHKNEPVAGDFSFRDSVYSRPLHFLFLMLIHGLTRTDIYSYCSLYMVSCSLAGGPSECGLPRL